MSKEEKQELQMKDEKRAFIREQIAPKRRSAIKRFVGAAFKTSCLAVIFGLVGGFVFCAVTPYLEERLGKKEEDPVLLRQVEQANEPTASPQQTPEPEKIKEKEPVSAVIDIDTYSDTYKMMKSIAEEFNHSVVKVSGVQSGVDWFDNPTEATNAASGIIIADSLKQIYILTNFDKIMDVSHIQVTFENDETVEAELRGKDKDTNIAVIAVDYESISSRQKKKLKIASFGDSYYAQMGTPVLALGSPDGYMYSMGIGMISGNMIDQYITDSMVEVFCTNIDGTDNGNGVIVDLEGRILGIITQQFNKEMKNSMCSAIGINRVKTMIEKMVNGTEQASFGVVAVNIPEEYIETLGTSHGIYVTKVVNNSPALDAGIQVGDIITHINQTEISSISNFNALLTSRMPKESLEVKLVRTSRLDKKEMKVKLILESR